MSGTARLFIFLGALVLAAVSPGVPAPMGGSAFIAGWLALGFWAARARA